MDANCFNLSLKDNRRLANDFGEIKTQELINKYFPDYNPDYNEFISNKDIINELNLKNLSQSNNILGTTYKKQISDAQLTNLKNKISIKNNQLNKQGESIVYKLYNVKQLGESDNYTWSIREIKGKLNVQDKIERAKARGQFQQAKDLEQGDQLKLFQLSAQPKSQIKPGVSELFESNPELANAVYEALGFETDLPSTDNVIKTENKEIKKERLFKRREIVLKEINKIEEFIDNPENDIPVYFAKNYEYDYDTRTYYDESNWEKDEGKFKEKKILKKPSYLHNHLNEELNKKIKNLQIINSSLYSDVEKVNYSNIFQEGKSYSSVEVLKYISENKQDVLNSIATTLLKYSEKNNVEIEIVKKEPKKPAGSYFYIKNKIVIYGDKNVTSHTLIHEIVHSLSSNYIENNPKSIPVLELKNILKNILDKKILKEYSNFENSYEDYATKDIHELLSEIISRPDILLHLSLYDTNYNLIKDAYKKETLLDKIVKILSDIFNFSKKEAETLSDLILFNARDIFEASTLWSEFNRTLITPQQKQQAQQLYSQYLDTIFPDSKVKDIVYHGTKGDKFDTIDFTKSNFGGNVFYVSTDKSEAKGYARKTGNVLALLINAKNVQFQRDAFFGNTPQTINEINQEIQDLENLKFGLQFIDEEIEVKFFNSQKEAKEFAERNSGWENLEEKVKQDKLKQLKILLNNLTVEGEFDTVLTNNDAGEKTIYIVNKLEQIHILGSKQDIEGFKEFVDKTPQQTLFQLQPEQNVNYILKIVNALDKVNRNKFETSKLQGWLNDLQKQGAPTQQLDLFKEVAKDGMTKDEIAAAILANYSYTVEINTAKEKYQTQLTLYGDANEEKYEYNGYEYIFDYDLNGQERFRKRKLDSKQFEKISDKEYLENSELANIKNTKYYSNITVPGGTNYTENEIATPAITSNIKGHAQFATDKGIGWFRSDEQVIGGKAKYRVPQEGEMFFEDEYNQIEKTEGGTTTKTRRILEVQSDLFQKWRNNFEFEGNKYTAKKDDKNVWHYYKNGNKINANEYTKTWEIFLNTYLDNADAFTKLLQKDNNWVTFFVKSIIQDSAKKGYEKVLFPSGNTASKVEGHTTLEEFKKQKEAQIKMLEEKKNQILPSNIKGKIDLETGAEVRYPEYSSKEYELKTLNEMINTYKQELERVEKEGFGALKPIYNFYENTVTNILKKQGYNPELITDEYGNTWNEVKIKPEQLNTILLQLKPEQTDSKEIIEQIDKNLNDYIKNNNINIEFKNQVLDSNGNDVVAFYDGVKKVIEINEGKRDSKTLPEELAHHLHLALGKDHILVKRAFNLLNKVDYKAMLGQEYVDLYKNNTDLLKFEILGKLTAAAVRGEKIPLQMNTVEGNKLWDTIKRMIDAVIKLFKPDANVQKELDNLSNQFADILKSGVKIDSESALKFKLYQFNQNNFDIKTDFIMSPKNFKLLDEGKKTVTLRNTNYSSGIYKFGENYYKVHNKFNEPVYLNDVQDSDLKKKFIGSEEIIKDYVDAFFKNEEKMYVYYIEKLDDVTQKLIKDQVESNKQALINIDINVKAAYVYYNKLLKKLKKDNLNYPDPNNPIRKSNEQKIKDIDLALKELTRLDNIQPLINLVNITLDEIDSYINRLDLILNNGGKPNFSNVSSTLATLNKLIDFPTTEKTAAELRRRLNVYLQMAVKEETDRLTGRDNKYDELFGLQEDISTAKKNFGTLVDIKNLLGRSLGLLIKESQNNIERDNSEIYNLIKEKTDNLEKWAKSENINLQKAYDILQQEYRGTYVLTKPYTSDFYKLINDSFDKPNGHEIRKKIATFDNNTKEFIPLNKKYVNSNYTKIQNTPALKEYYEFFKATTKNVSDNILPLNLSDNFIPNIYQKTLIDIFNTEEALDEKTKKAVQHILDFNIFEKMTDDKKYLFDESLMEGDLDLKYLKNLPTDVKSKDLSYNLLKFMYFANSYNHMSEVLEKAKVFLEVSKNVKFIKSNDPTLSIQGDKSSTYDMMQSFFDMQVLGKLKKEQKIEVLGYNFNYGNLFDLLTGFTSLLRLGLNPFNAIANVLTGTVGNIIEATGGRYFNIADYIKARKIFAEMVIDTDSKLYKLIYKINPLQELDDYENLKKIGIGTAKYWEKVKSIMFSPQRFGEFNLQTTPMIAIMLHTDVDIIKNGKVVGKTKMWDAFNEDGEWDTAKMGYELSDFELNRLTNKIHRVNQMIHGRYSSKDASILSQDVFFRMAFQFKKWIPAAIESRLGAEQYDERLDDTVKGRWRSYGPFIKYYMGGLWSKAIGDAKALENNKPLSDIDKYNMYKNAVELVIAAGILLLTKGIEDEEDKKKSWYKLTMRQLNQLSGDLLYFYNPKEMSESAFGGVAAAKTIKDIARTVNYIPYAFADKNNQKAYYRSGKRKHENKFWAGMLDITPGAKSITESVRLFKSDVPYTEPVD